MAERGFQQPSGDWLVLDYEERAIEPGETYYWWVAGEERLLPHVMVADHKVGSDKLVVRAPSVGATFRIERR